MNTLTLETGDWKKTLIFKQTLFNLGVRIISMPLALEWLIRSFFAPIGIARFDVTVVVWNVQTSGCANLYKIHDMYKLK